MDHAVNQSTVPHLYHVHLSNYCFANIWASEFITANLCPFIQHRRQMLRTLQHLRGLHMDECGIRRRCVIYVAVHGLLQHSNRWFTIQRTQSLYFVPQRVDFKLFLLKCWPHGLSPNSLLRFQHLLLVQHFLHRSWHLTLYATLKVERAVHCSYTVIIW